MASALVLLSVFVLDLIAFGLAVAAERRRAGAVIVKDTVSNSSYCQYESDIATGMGVGSMLFLLLTQLLIMFATKCLCCGRALKPGGSRAWAIVLFITCWVTFFIAEVCLLAGSVRNAYHTKYRGNISDIPPSCETLRRGVFGAGAAFIFFTAIISELYYVCFSKANNAHSSYSGDTGVRMGTYS